MKMNHLLLSLFVVSSSLNVLSQVFDILAIESFDNTTNLTTDTGFGNEDKSCSTSDMFDVSATHTDPTDITNSVNFEDGSVFCGSDINGITGVATPSYLEVFNYSVTDNDPISFYGDFAFIVACGGGQDYDATDNLVVQYSTNGGTSYTTALTFTGTGLGSSFSNSDDHFTCSDGTSNVVNDLLEKGFSIGSGLNGSTIKIKILISGFTDAGEGFFLDEFKLVRTRTELQCENFDNTTSLTSSSGAVFQTPNESATCNSNSLYDVTANMGTPSNATSCIEGETGSFFVMTDRNSLTGVADGEELELLTYTAIDNNFISFKGNFASFGNDQNTDNNIVISYSTDNGTSYTDALTITGITGSGGTLHSCSDGSPNISNHFLTRRFPIGSGLLGQTIKIKVTFNNYSNSGDGIALDEFCLEGSLDPTVLPVELINFRAEKRKDKNTILWSTLSESNNSHFELERSDDGMHWEIISEISGMENSFEQTDYSYDDELPLIETNYYRLKQVDFDGNHKYSKVVVVRDRISDIQVFPSPVKMGQKINLMGQNKNTLLTIYDINGLELYAKELETNVDVIKPNLPSGFYILKFNYYGLIKTTKLIIQ